MEILPVTSPVSSIRKPSYKIQTQNLSYKIQTMYDEFDWVICNKFLRRSPKYILKDVNCEALPGEITAIAGPSGAGKTTLLEILGGKIPSPTVSAGQVLINGCPMDGKRFRRLSGYVTQDDALFPLLTVKETLVYSALLRLKGGRKEAEVRAKMVIKELGLDHVAGSRIGEGTNGVSGGERRRVSIGVELVHDPAVILIDEPTSGLDSASALHIISLLKSMVENQSKTIVLTIHQPGFRILNLFNRLVLLTNGYVFHNGSLKLLEERLTCFGYSIPPHVNILEFAVDVTSSLIIRSSDHQNTSEIITIRSPKIQKNHNLSYPNSPFEEILILSQRFFKNIFRTKELFLTRILQALVTGLILGTIFMNAANNQDHLALQTRIGFFAYSLSFLLSSSTEGLPIFLQERRIFMRETSSGAYRVSSYVIANTLIFLPFLLMVGLLYTTSVYFLVGLRREFDGFAYFVLVVWMVIMMSNSFTACFSALVPNFIMGTSVISGLMGSFFLFSGYFISKENIPSYWIFMHYMSLFKYPFECFMINQYGGDEGKLKCVKSEEGECTLYGDGFLKEQSLVESQKWSNLGVMLSFVIGYRILCYLILRCRCYKTRN